MKAEEKIPDPLPEPHSAWWHPEKTWTDIILFNLLSLVYDFKKVLTLPPTDSAATIQVLQKFREGCSDNDLKCFRTNTVPRWKKAVGCHAIVHAELDIAHKKANTFFQDWGLDPATPPLQKHLPDLFRNPVKLHVFGPSSVLTGDEDGNGAPSTELSSPLDDYGCVKKEQIDWSKISSDIPIILYLHGGAMIFESLFNPDGVEPLAELAEAAVPGKNKPFILVVVDYAVAPEHPFPAATVDVLTAMDYLLDDVNLPNKNPIHLKGISAGGHFGSVAAMECIRRYGPKGSRLSSVFVHCPTCNPACDTLSYHLNGPSAICSDFFCRWIWQCYMEFPPSKDTDIANAKTPDEILGLHSNRTAWKESPWRNTSFERLADPHLDLPKGLNETPCRFVLTTFRGDTMHDEGVSLARAIEAQNGKILHIDCSGSHWYGIKYDKVSHKTMLDEWKKAIWP